MMGKRQGILNQATCCQPCLCACSPFHITQAGLHTKAWMYSEYFFSGWKFIFSQHTKLGLACQDLLHFSLITAAANRFKFESQWAESLPLLPLHWLFESLRNSFLLSSGLSGEPLSTRLSSVNSLHSAGLYMFAKLSVCWSAFWGGGWNTLSSQLCKHVIAMNLFSIREDFFWKVSCLNNNPLVFLRLLEQSRY